MKTELFREQFIPDHVFFYVSKGTLNCYDRNKSYTFTTGEYCIARKNRLGRYSGEKGKEFEVTFICFEEAVIRRYENNYKPKTILFSSSDTFIKIRPTERIPEFINLLNSSYHHGEMADSFTGIKQEELLMILLQNQPDLAGLFFRYESPHKINLEEFMNRNYQFNVSVERFAYLTGRSLSAFKRDFKTTFHNTPNRWLIKKRLQEAHFLIEKKNKKPAQIYIDLGFESLSHFSYAFKKQFGLTPTKLVERKNYTSAPDKHLLL